MTVSVTWTVWFHCQQMCFADVLQLKRSKPYLAKGRAALAGDTFRMMLNSEAIGCGYNLKHDKIDRGAFNFQVISSIII